MESELNQQIARTGGFPVAGVHRGGAPHIGPENTLLAFRRSVEFGSRLLELDVRLTRDRQPILMHDCNTMRTTGHDANVWDLTLAEIQSLDAAYNDDQLRGTGIRVPTLQEFLSEFVPQEELLFLLDFKDGESVKVALAIVEPLGIEHRLLLGSVFGPVNQILRQQRSGVPISTDTKESIRIISLYQFGLLEMHHFHHQIFGFILRKETRRFWSYDLVRTLRGRGIQILVCGSDLDDPSVLRECIAWGCEYILTDSPDVLHSIMNEK